MKKILLFPIYFILSLMVLLTGLLVSLVNAQPIPSNIANAVMYDVKTICWHYPYQEYDQWTIDQQRAWVRQGFRHLPNVQELNNFCKEKV